MESSRCVFARLAEPLGFRCVFGVFSRFCPCLRVRVWQLGLSFYGPGFRVQGAGFKVQGARVGRAVAHGELQVCLEG